MAKAKSNKISINALEKVAKSFKNEVTFEWEGLQVTVKPVLSLEEFVDFVRSVVRCCFSEMTGEYMPEARDVCIRSNILDHYANFTMPQNSDTQFDLVWKTDAVDVVLEHVNQEQFKELIRCIDREIEYMVASDVERIRVSVTDTVNAMSEVVDKFNELFGGIAAEDIKSMVGAISDHGMDEEKLAQAVLAQRMSDAANGPHLVAPVTGTATL